MQAAYETLLSRKPATSATGPVKSKTGKLHPRILSLGGDHSIVIPSNTISKSQALPALRALGDIYGPISVVHFDSHLDTYVSHCTSLSLGGRDEHIHRYGRARSLILLMGQCSGFPST